MSDLIFIPLTEAFWYLLLAYGIYISFRVLNFPDLSTDSVFSFGAMVGTYFWLSTNNIVISLLFALIGGGVIGMITSMLHSYGHISKLLCGILIFTMLYSINLRIFNTSNVPFPNEIPNVMQISVVVDSLVFTALFLLMKTVLGASLVTQGSNPRIHDEQGSYQPLVLGLGLAISSGLISLSGFITAINFGFSDTQMGFGMLVHGVAGILIGEGFHRTLKINLPIAYIFLGVFTYCFILHFVNSFIPTAYFSPSDTKLISGVLVVLFLFLNKNKDSNSITI